MKLPCPVCIRAIRMFGHDTHIYSLPAQQPLLGDQAENSGVYVFLSSSQVEFGSTKSLQRRFNERFFHARWATHVLWMDLRRDHWLNAEYRLYIEALCINTCNKTDFLGRQVRNRQFSRTMGRFSGADYAVGLLGVEFLQTIRRSCPLP